MFTARCAFQMITTIGSVHTMTVRLERRFDECFGSVRDRLRHLAMRLLSLRSWVLTAGSPWRGQHRDFCGNPVPKVAPPGQHLFAKDSFSWCPSSCRKLQRRSWSLVVTLEKDVLRDALQFEPVSDWARGQFKQKQESKPYILISSSSPLFTDIPDLGAPILEKSSLSPKSLTASSFKTSGILIDTLHSRILKHPYLDPKSM